MVIRLVFKSTWLKFNSMCIYKNCQTLTLIVFENGASYSILCIKCIAFCRTEIHNRSFTNTRAGKTVITEIKFMYTVISFYTCTYQSYLSWYSYFSQYFVENASLYDKLTAGAKVQVGIGSSWYKPRHFVILCFLQNDVTTRLSLCEHV